jgi:hypothetical protein
MIQIHSVSITVASCLALILTNYGKPFVIVSIWQSDEIFINPLGETLPLWACVFPYFYFLFGETP